MTDYLLALALLASLWAGVFFVALDAGSDVFGAAAASFIIAIILMLPAAFLAGLVWRLVSWIHDTWFYRPPLP